MLRARATARVVEEREGGRDFGDSQRVVTKHMCDMRVNDMPCQLCTPAPLIPSQSVQDFHRISSALPEEGGIGFLIDRPSTGLAMCVT